MPSAVRLREDYSAEQLRALARRSKYVNQSRRLLSLAAVRDGMDRGSGGEGRGHGPPDAARLGPSLQRLGELHGKIGDGVNQAADLISATASIPSLNFIPLTTFGNWF